MQMNGFLVPAVGLIALLVCAGSCAAATAAPARPNVILIITDDQGYGDLGTHGNPVIRTPHLDAMARRSASMQTFYVSPVCAPTRACLMTGRYNYRTRVVDTYIGRAMMDPDEVTIAEILRGAGYATGIFGKWHLGDSYPMRPMDQGFEESLVHRGGGIGQPSDPPGGEGKYTDPVLQHNGVQMQAKGYCTDVYFETAMRWIEAAHKQGRSFFAYIATNAPHGPFHDVPEQLYQFYKTQDLSRVLVERRQSPERRAGELDDLARIFAMITSIDENVGRLFRRLDELKLTADTIVIFMVDNGPNTARYVAGMRGMKSHVHEGGIRSPFFVHWPAQLKAGHSSDRIAAHIDVLPTLLDACGVARPAGLKLDGRSLLPLLKGGPVDWPDRTICIQTHRGDVPVMYHHFMARSQQWKLVNPSGFGQEQLPEPPQFELYDMAADPLEKQNVAAAHPDAVARMKKAYEDWFTDVSSTRPDNYAPPRIHIGTPHENPVVLTRQDWRRVSKDTGWAPGSIGCWVLFVAADAEYDIHVRFPAIEAAGQAELRIGGRSLKASLSKGADHCLFANVPLSQGNARLEVTLTVGETVQGPWQVDVARK